MLNGRTIVDIQPLAPRDFHAAQVQTKQTIHRGVQVRDIVWMFDGVESKFIRRTVNSGFDSRSGEPDRETVRMMITASCRLVEHTVFDSGGSTELGGENDKRVFKHASLF